MNVYSKLIVITNSQICTHDFLEQIAKVCALKPASLILREKELSQTCYALLAGKVLEICQHYQVPMFVHSNLETADTIACQGIHVPYSLLLAKQAALLQLQKGQGKQLSVACHSYNEALTAAELGANQVILGTIFATACKPGKAGAGLTFLQQVCKDCTVPVYAIGGISEAKLPALLEAGAAGGCMMSGFMKM